MKYPILPLLIGAVLVLAGPSAGSGKTGAGLPINISDLRSDRGRIGCQLFNSPEGFPEDTSKAFRKQWCPIENRSSTCGFDSIPPGTYAAACFHDENLNGKLDRGMLGIPKEGVSVSNYPNGVRRPPSFKRARFIFPGNATGLDFRLTY